MDNVLGFCNHIVEWVHQPATSTQEEQNTTPLIPTLQLSLEEKIVQRKKRKRDKEEFVAQEETIVSIRLVSGQWKREFAIQDKNISVQHLLQHILKPLLLILESKLNEKKFRIQIYCTDAKSVDHQMLYVFPSAQIASQPGSGVPNLFESYKMETSTVLKDKKSALDIQVQVFEMQSLNISSPNTILFGVKPSLKEVVFYEWITQPIHTKDLVLCIAHESDIQFYLKKYSQWLPRLYKAFANQSLWKQKYAPTLSSCMMQIIQRASPSPFSKECMQLLQEQNKTLDELLEPLIPQEY